MLKILLRSKMKKTIILFTLAVIVTACGSKSDKTTAEVKFDAVAQYLAIKDALVSTDATKTQKAAKEFLKGNTNATLTEALEAMATTNDVAIQRSAFELLSEKMYSIVKTDGVATPLYKQYCPMAFNNKGAYWLAAEVEVNNPYFGDAMLHCGSVQETISQ